MMEYYRQCSLKKGEIVTTAWIPEKFARLEKQIKLKNANDEWEDGWVVIQVGCIRFEEQYLIDRSQDYKRTRKASDI